MLQELDMSQGAETEWFQYHDTFNGEYFRLFTIPQVFYNFCPCYKAKSYMVADYI